jgi:Flp pilus assembly protein protease CpaA
MILEIALVLTMLLLASVFDLKNKTIPGMVIYPFLLIGLFIAMINMAVLSGHGIFTYSALLLAAGFLVIGIVLSKLNILGFGDTLLIIAIILMTPPEFMTIDFFLVFGLITCLTGLLYFALITFLSKKSLDKDNTIKFVPCIVIGYMIAIYGLFGVQIMTTLGALL